MRTRPAARLALPLFLALSFPVSFACTRTDSLDEIRELHAAGRFEETIVPLRRIVDRDPDRAEAELLLGRALLETDNSGLAVWPLRKAAETPEYAVEAGLLLTQAMLASRTAPDALEEIDRVLAIDPDNLQARVLRVEANTSSGNLEAALEDVDRVLEIDPDNLPVLVTRVTTLLALDRIDEAGEALDATLSSFRDAEADVAQPMLARLCMARALFTFQKGDREAAETRYAECIEQFPTERVAVTEAVSFYDRIGRRDRGTEILERAAKESDNSLFATMLARRLGALGAPDDEERLLREEAEQRPTALSWFVLADYYVQHERYETALEAFRHALEIGPASPRLRFAYADTLVQARRFDEAREVASHLEQRELRHLIRGRILLGEGDARGALAALEAGIRLWPNNATGRYLAGQAAERVGDFPRAISHYRESFRTSPGDTEAGRALVELYALHGEDEGALQIAARYIQSHVADPKAYLSSIRLAHAMGRHEIVVEGLQRLAQLPGQAPIAVAEEASLLAASGDAEKAIEGALAAGLDWTDPSNAVALRVVLAELVALGRNDEAAELLAPALAARPDAAVFHELEGRVHRAAGRSDAARASWERAIELDPHDAPALAGLAELAAEAGDRERALELYDRAIAEDPEDPAPALAAIALVRGADPGGVAERLARLLDADPRNASAAIELAGLLADRGELDEAHRLAARAAWLGAPAAEAALARIGELRAAAPDSDPPIESVE